LSNDTVCSDLPTRAKPEIGKVLVTAPTGYVGGRLVPELLARGYSVRVMVRSASLEYQQRWPAAEIVTADVLQLENLKTCMEGVHTAYYLRQSFTLQNLKDDISADIHAASIFRRAAEDKGIKRIIYFEALSNIINAKADPIRSRLEIARELGQGNVSTTVLFADIIIGSGSASYEFIKNLVRRVPVLIIPKWATNKCRPIAIRDVIKYLVGVLEVPETSGKTFEISGKDILAYEMMLRIMAEIFWKKRLFIPVPFSLIRFLAYVGSLLTPVPASINRQNLTAVRDLVFRPADDINDFLSIQTLSYKEAVVRAMSREEQDEIHTRWTDSHPAGHELALKLSELEEPPRFSCTYALITEKDASSLFDSICRIGGKGGWLHSTWMWEVRGVLDRLLLGVGTSRGRRSTSSLRINDVVDFWRVEDMIRGKMLLLRAEMRMPGKAWLQFTIEPKDDKHYLTVTPYFHTKSLFGKMYWYVFLPFHHFIFINLLKEIAKRS
jgi:uncharacterized protein YbjT (DUF2867 family)